MNLFSFWYDVITNQFVYLHLFPFHPFFLFTSFVSFLLSFVFICIFVRSCFMILLMQHLFFLHSIFNPNSLDLTYISISSLTSHLHLSTNFSTLLVAVNVGAILFSLSEINVKIVDLQKFFIYGLLP